MSRKKFRRWLDLRNRKTALLISQRYYQNTESRKDHSLIDKQTITIFIKRALLILAGSLVPRRDIATTKDLPLLKKISGLNEFEVDLLPQNPHLTPIKFKEELTPLVSIIIDGQEDLIATYNCLFSVFQNTSDVSYQLILITDFIQHDILPLIENPKSVTYIGNSPPLGSLKSRNKASELAKGKYLCFLNGKTQVTKNWLLNMVSVFMNQRDTGLVGAKLVYPFGLLKAAGGLINSPDLIKHYGHYEDPEHNKFNYLRETDFCPGTCLLILKDDFNKLSGFDQNFDLDRTEAIDLSLSVHYQLKKKVYYQPLSKVVDFENGYDIRKSEILKNKWASVFSNLPTGNSDEASLRKFNKKNCILFIDAFLPEYDKNSGSRRIFELIKIFISLNFDLIFLADNGKKTEPYFTELTNLGVRVIYPIIPFRNPFQELTDILSQVSIAWVSRPELNVLYGPLIQKFSNIVWIYDTVDLHFVRLQREADLLLDSKLSQLASEAKDRELSIAKQADMTIAITETEKRLLEKESIEKVIVIPNIHKMIEPDVTRSFENRTGLLFIGGYDHTPNIDAVRWLVTEIMPKVWKIDPLIHLTLLGSNPTQEILDYRSERIDVPGFIHDVSPYFNNSRVFVAPLRFGAGMKGKIGQSLEHALPVVSTSVGTEGMSLIHDLHVLIADSTFDFAAKIIELYQSRLLWEKLKSNSSQALDNYTPEYVTEELKALLNILEHNK